MYMNSDGVMVYSLKDKYKYYKAKADDKNLKGQDGKPVSFTSRVGIATKANSIRRRMRRNKQQFDHFGNAICGTNFNK